MEASPAYSERKPARPAVLEHFEQTLQPMLRTNKNGMNEAGFGGRLLHRRSVGQIQLSELALSVGVHPVHLTRAFREQHGVTIPAYVRQLRVDAARKLLKSSSLSLADIAGMVGFADQSHLTRVFKRLTGVPPGQYRRGGGVRSGNST